MTKATPLIFDVPVAEALAKALRPDAEALAMTVRVLLALLPEAERAKLLDA